MAQASDQRLESIAHHPSPLIAAVVVGILTGLAPILQAGRVSLTEDLKTGVRDGTYHRSRARTDASTAPGSRPWS